MTDLNKTRKEMIDYISKNTEFIPDYLNASCVEDLISYLKSYDNDDLILLYDEVYDNAHDNDEQADNVVYDLVDDETENEDEIPTLENFGKIKNSLFPKLTSYGSPAPKYTEYTSKDKMRIEDILTKSDRMAKRKLGNFTAVKYNNIDKEEGAKAQQMANAITDYFKAVRRGNAAIALGKPEIAKIFYKKAQVLRPNNMSEAIVTDVDNTLIVLFDAKDILKLVKGEEVFDDKKKYKIKVNLAADDIYDTIKNYIMNF